MNGNLRDISFPFFVLVLHVLCFRDDKLASGSEILVSNGTAILRVDTRTKSKSVVIYQPFGRIVGVAADLEDDWLFWSDVSIDNRGLYKSRINGSQPEILVKDVYEVNGLTVNWVSDHVYWTDAQQSTINVVNYDGSGRYVLLSLGAAHEPRGIIADPVVGYLFWTDQRKGTVERSRLNGQDRHVIVDNDIYWPNQLAISRVFRKLYWIEASPISGIMSCDLDGDNYKMERPLSDVTSNNPSFGLVVLGNKALVSTWFTNVIYSTLVETPYSMWSKEVTDVGTEELFSMTSLDESTQPILSHPCSGVMKGGCSHLCLPSGWGQHYTCLCPSFQGLALGSDNITCEEPSSVLLSTFQESGIVGLTSLLKANIPQLNIIAISHSPIAVTVDFSNNKTVYWSDEDNIIYYTDVGSSVKKTFLNQTNGIGRVTKMAFDQSSDNLYFINTGSHSSGGQVSSKMWYRIEVVAIATKYRKVIVGGSTEISDILLDTDKGYMYYVYKGTDHTIVQRNLDGSNPLTLVSMGTKCYHLSEVVPSGNGSVLVLSDRTGSPVEYYSVDTSHISGEYPHIDKVVIPKYYTDAVFFRAVKMSGHNDTTELIDGPCHLAPCSHLCFPNLANQKTYTCGCPDMSMLTPDKDGANCTRPDNFLLIADINRILMIDLDIDSQPHIKTLYFSHLHSNIVSMVYDSDTDILYWLDQARFQIFSLNLTSMSVKELYDTDQILGDLDIDIQTQRLYWTSWNRSFSGKIKTMDLTRGVSSVKTLVKTENIPRSLAVSKDGMHIYWGEDKNGYGSLHMYHVNASEQTEFDLGDFPVSIPSSLVIMEDSLLVSDIKGRLYTVNINDTEIQRTKFLTGNKEAILDLTILNSLFFFTNTDSLYMVSMTTGQQTILAEGMSHPTAIVLYHPDDLTGYDVCANQTACSHLCIPLPRGQSWCYCPPGYVLRDKHDCVKASDPWEESSSDLCDDFIPDDPHAVCAKYVSSFNYHSVCLPGYHKNTSYCQACKEDTFLPIHNNDSACLPCPVTMTTRQLTAAVNCSCSNEDAELVNGSCKTKELSTSAMTTVTAGLTTEEFTEELSTSAMTTVTAGLTTEEFTEEFTKEFIEELSKELSATTLYYKQRLSTKAGVTEQMLREPNYRQQSWPTFDNCPDGKMLTLNLPPFRSKAKLPVTWSAYDNVGNKLKIKSNYQIRKEEITLEWISNGQKGKHMVVNVAEDQYGRKSTCRFYVLVTDKEPPHFTYCPHDLNFLSQELEDRVFWLRPEAEDNIKVSKSHASHEPGDIFPRGVTMVTYTATDPAGNVAYCNFTVTVSEAKKSCSLPTVSHGIFACNRKLGSLEETCHIVCESNHIINPLEIFSKQFTCQKHKQIRDLEDILKQQEPCLSIRVPSMVTQEFTMVFKGQCDSDDLDLQKALSSALVEYIAARNICPQPKCGYSNVTVDCDSPESRSEDRKRRSVQYVTLFMVKWNVTIDNSTGFNHGQIEAILINLRLELMKLIQTPLYVGSQEYVALPDVKFSDLIWGCQQGEMSTEHGCVGCPKGTRHDYMIDKCMRCPVGTFQPYDSQSDCIQCGPGKTSPELAVSETSCKLVDRDMDEMSKFLIISACSFGFVFLVLTLIFYLHYKKQQKRSQDRSTYSSHKYITPNIYVAPPPIPRMQNTKRSSPRNSPLTQRKFPSPKPLLRSSAKNSPILSCKSDILRMPPGALNETGTLTSQRFNIYKNHDYEDVGYQTTASNASNFSTRTNISGRTDYQNERSLHSPPASPCSAGSRSQLGTRSPTSSRSPMGSRSPLASPVSERAIYTGDFKNFSPTLHTNSLRSQRERQLYLYDK